MRLEPGGIKGSFGAQTTLPPAPLVERFTLTTLASRSPGLSPGPPPFPGGWRCMVIDPLAVPWEGLTVTLEIPSLAVYRCRVALRGGLTQRPFPCPGVSRGTIYYLQITHPAAPHLSPSPIHPGIPPQTTTRARTPDPAPIYPYHTTTPTITTPAPSSRTTPNHAVTHRIICCRAILQPGSDQNIFQSQPASPPKPIQFPPARRALLLLQPAALAGDSPPLSRSQIDTFLDISFNRYPSTEPPPASIKHQVPP